MYKSQVGIMYLLYTFHLISMGKDRRDVRHDKFDYTLNMFRLFYWFSRSSGSFMFSKLIVHFKSSHRESIVRYFSLIWTIWWESWHVQSFIRTIKLSRVWCMLPRRISCKKVIQFSRGIMHKYHTKCKRTVFEQGLQEVERYKVPICIFQSETCFQIGFHSQARSAV